MPIVDCKGTPIHYAERGKGPPLLLLMGLGADGSLWEQHVQAYEPFFRCILLDNRGAGQSHKPPGPYTIAAMASDAIALLDALGIESAHISGISMGGAIAQELACISPERVRSLTLNCSWSECDAYTTRIFETFRQGYANMQAGDFQKLLQLFIYTPAYHEQHLPELLDSQSNAEENRHPMPVHAFQAQCDACMSHYTTGRLHEIKAPTLITVGELDIFTPPHCSQSIAREIEHSQLVIFEGSGHTHHWDQLEAFNRLTLEFLKKQEGMQ